MTKHDKFRCINCSHYSVNKAGFKKHAKECSVELSKGGKILITCFEKKKKLTKSYLKEHVTAKHADRWAEFFPNEEMKLLACDLCGETFRHRQILAKHSCR